MSTIQITRSLVAALFVLSIQGVFHSANAAETCSYDLDAQSLQVNWTAYKTMQKVGVGGSFTEVTVEGDLSSSKSLAALLNQLDAEIDVNQAEKIRTGNPGRDATIMQNFFSHFHPKALLKGKLRNVKGDDEKGELNLVLSMNRKTLAVPMKYSRDSNGALVVKGAIDVNDFGLSGALALLHKSCEHLHKGPDGVSKTWPQVEIKLSANVAKNCK
jgi:hypothetical protein